MHAIRIAFVVAVLDAGCSCSNSTTPELTQNSEPANTKDHAAIKQDASEEKTSAETTNKKKKPVPEAAANSDVPVDAADDFETSQEKFFAKTNAEALAQIKDEAIRSWIKAGLNAKIGKERDAVVERFRGSKSASICGLANVMEDIADAGDPDRSRVPFIVKDMAIAVRPKGVSDAELLELMENKSCSSYGLLWLIGNTLQHDGVSWDEYIDPKTLFQIAAIHPELRFSVLQVIGRCGKRAQPHLPTLVKWLIESDELHRPIYMVTIINVDIAFATSLGFNEHIAWDEVRERAVMYLRKHIPPPL